MDDAGTGRTRDHSARLLDAVAQILGPDDQVTGAGFLAAEGILVTCAHVVRAAGAGPGEHVQLVFPHADGAPRLEGLVLEEPWRAPEDEDVAVLLLADVSAVVEALPLGSAAGCRDHAVRSFGFPTQAPVGGHYGYAVAGDLLPATEGRGIHVQLTGANDLTTGFSGAPVMDEVTGLVVGMLTEITAPDEHERGQGIAYITPVDVLREIWPELTEQDVCPYRGLESFTAEDARWFEGRKDAVRQVLANMDQQQRVTLLLGPSGSGKSSLIQAGVLPALAAGGLPGSDTWLPVVIRPRQDLLAELDRAGLSGVGSDGIATAVTRRLSAEPACQRVVLIIDQFEELFTHPAAGQQLEHRLAATDQITTAVRSHAALDVILIMRDDFYPQQAALAPKLLEAAMPGLLNIPGTLSRYDLHDIITLPALNAGARFEHGLPEQIISDVLATTPEGATTSQAPVTVLPLLELTLSQLWQRRHDGYLTHDAYRRIGGVTGSLTTWCDTALNQLPAEQRPIAQRILTSLVRSADPRHNIPAIREQVPLQELREMAAGLSGEPDGGQDIDEVLAHLTRHRIITTHTLPISLLRNTPPPLPVAELIHDALIRDWGTLRDWVHQDHRFQEWLDHSRARRARYVEENHPGDLLGGTALAEGLEWSQQRRLPGDIATFLTASKQRQQAVIRRSRRLNTILAALLALALVAMGGAVWQWRTAVTQQQAAQSRELATQSSTLIGKNPDLAALLAVQAYRTSPTPESKESLRNAAALPLQRRLTGHTDWVNRVAFSPDGRTLATGSGDGSVRLWDVATGAMRSTLPQTVKVGAVAFSPDGRTLATDSDDNTVVLWDVATDSPRHTLKGHSSGVWSMAFSPDGHTLATGSADRTVRLWEVTTGMLRDTFTVQSETVGSVAFSPDGRTLATEGDRYTVVLRDAPTGKILSTLTTHTDGVMSMAFSPDGSTLATGSADNSAALWDVATGTIRTTLPGHTDSVTSVAFSPDGHTLATGSHDKTVRLWDLTTGTNRLTLTGHTDSVDCLAFSPDGHVLATGSTDKTAVLWDVATGKRRVTLKGHTDRVTSVAFSPDGHTLATGSVDKTARLWDVATGKPRATLKDHTDQVTSVAFSPDGRTLATGSRDTSVLLWDLATDEVRDTLTHSEAVASVAFSPDGHTLAIGSVDNTVFLWTANALDETPTTLTGHAGPVYAVAFSPDGRTLATGSADTTVWLWDVRTHENRAILPQNDTVYAVAFSPDGQILATGTIDNTARLWDVRTHETHAALHHNDTVNAVAFSPDGHTLATGGHDKTARLWDVAILQPTEAAHKICRAVGRDFTPEEHQAYLPGQSVGPVCPTG
ncbi:nSTAND1 domain-containing NTPase [Streptomyces sp. NBC_00503]|uniref:nSTAND1 domain-containing NTPase n=1 Tax=Streptomyces sp. NBC_00503 TaxID=2903659 RepID=UPI002E80FF28|nr:trypsin-like peptidase domain-containing protein [Streptomyces sp. NBC_00503]WUD85050.1 trypsin-like peptidase domain-containing protein [Streptomyces sp. NBC_00503]